jgi:hypothetical protein
MKASRCVPMEESRLAVPNRIPISVTSEVECRLSSQSDGGIRNGGDLSHAHLSVDPDPHTPLEWALWADR